MSHTVQLQVEAGIATITNDNPDHHNAFDDDMDAQLFEILARLRDLPEVRAVIWRGNGPSFSSGRDVSSIGTQPTGLSHHELMRRGHRGIQQLWDLDAPVIVACHGWVIGASFQRALLCDIRVASEDAKFRLPETRHGVIPDTGGMGVLFQIAGPGLVSDMVLTNRVLTADEALSHGIVSRVVPGDELDSTVRAMAEQIVAAPRMTIRMAREVVRHLSLPELRSSMADELVYQTFLKHERDHPERNQRERDQDEHEAGA